MLTFIHNFGFPLTSVPFSTICIPLTLAFFSYKDGHLTDEMIIFSFLFIYVLWQRALIIMHHHVVVDLVLMSISMKSNPSLTLNDKL